VIDDADVTAVREAGDGDAGIAEVVAHVGRNAFTNSVNDVIGPPLDIPGTPALGCGASPKDTACPTRQAVFSEPFPTCGIRATSPSRPT
jgi:hypothetical protein